MIRSALLCTSLHVAASTCPSAAGTSRRCRTRALLRLPLLQIVLVAIDEHHRVGILLDRAGLTQIGQLRPLVLTVLHLARELRQREHRHVQLLGDRLQTLGDLADLQHAVLRLGAGRRTHQLQIVDHDQRQPLGALQPPAARAQRRQRDRRGVVDLDRQRGEISRLTCTNLSKSAGRSRRGGSGRWRPALLPTSRRVANCSALISSEKIATHALRHRVRIVRARLGQQRLGRAEGDLGGQRGLAHARPARPGSRGRTVQCRPSWRRGRAGRWSGPTRGRCDGTRVRRRRSPRSARARSDEAAGDGPVGGQVEQRLLGRLDLLRAVQFGDRRRTRCSPPSRRYRSSWRRSQASWIARPYSPALMMPTMAVRSCAR